MGSGCDRGKGLAVVKDYTELAKTIIGLVGGRWIINSVAHCITRLRVRPKDESKADDEKLQATRDVIKVMHAQGQYQVVVGQVVDNPPNDSRTPLSSPTVPSDALVGSGRACARGTLAKRRSNHALNATQSA